MKMALNMSNKTSKFYIVAISALPHLLILFHAVCGHNVSGPCHHGMARPQIADRGTASDKEGSCEYIE